MSVMAPVAPRDAMNVMCATETLAVVIKFLRDEGFTEAEKKAKASGLPPGIYTRGSRFLAVKLGGGGCKKHKIGDDVESGVAWQSMNTDDADDEDAMPYSDEFPEEAAYTSEQLCKARHVIVLYWEWPQC